MNWTPNGNPERTKLSNGPIYARSRHTPKPNTLVGSSWLGNTGHKGCGTPSNNNAKGHGNKPKPRRYTTNVRDF